MAQHNADLSMRNFERSLRVPRALGLDVDQAKVLAQSSAAGLLPKAVFESMLALGRRPLQALEQPGQVYGATCLAKARQVLRDGAGLPLLFPHDDLGFCYGKKGEGGATRSLGALVPDGRLPHAWLQCPHPETGASLGTVSTTDLADQLHVAALPSTASPPVPVALLLTTGTDAADAVALGPTSRLCWAGGEVALRHVEIVSAEGSSGPIDKATSTTFAELAQADKQVLMQHLNETGRLRLLDTHGRWRAKTGGKDIAVLLRPDGHIWQVFGSSQEGSQPLAEAFSKGTGDKAMWLVK